ncbi:hypothetical protein H4R21_002252, partial [Coemansia helicoidea]
PGHGSVHRQAPPDARRQRRQLQPDPAVAIADCAADPPLAVGDVPAAGDEVEPAAPHGAGVAGRRQPAHARGAAAHGQVAQLGRCTPRGRRRRRPGQPGEPVLPRPGHPRHVAAPHAAAAAAGV